jgi:hypothetical protein
MTAAVETNGLTKTFGATRAVDGLDLCVEPGQVFGFLGPSRSVPSVLVRVTPAGSSVKAAPSRAVSCAIPRSGSGSVSARSSSASMIASGWRGSWRPVSPTGCWRSGSVQPAP